MRRHRLALLLSAGLLVAVLVSACGVALGPAQFTVGGPAVFSPTIFGLHLPALHPTVAPSAQELQRYQITDAQSLFANHALGCHGLD